MIRLIWNRAKHVYIEHPMSQRTLPSTEHINTSKIRKDNPRGRNGRTTRHQSEKSNNVSMSHICRSRSHGKTSISHRGIQIPKGSRPYVRMSRRADILHKVVAGQKCTDTKNKQCTASHVDQARIRKARDKMDVTPAEDTCKSSGNICRPGL